MTRRLPFALAAIVALSSMVHCTPSRSPGDAGRDAESSEVGDDGASSEVGDDGATQSSPYLCESDEDCAAFGVEQLRHCAWYIDRPAEPPQLAGPEGGEYRSCAWCASDDHCQAGEVCSRDGRLCLRARPEPDAGTD